MSQTRPALDTTIRPRVLVVAARHGLAQYDRARYLPRLLGLPAGRVLPDTAAALDALRARERATEDARRRHAASWRAAEHVLLMTALLAEARLCGPSPCNAERI